MPLQLLYGQKYLLAMPHLGYERFVIAGGTILSPPAAMAATTIPRQPAVAPRLLHAESAITIVYKHR